ncbi:MAG: ABC transporter permease, partial [Gemmatimonadaceae bacterium]
MTFSDVLATAFGQISANKLRSFFTLLGIIVSVTFLVAVLAIIQGMNSYVKENVAGAMIGSNSFQVRRTPINITGFVDDQLERMARWPVISKSDAAAVEEAVPDAEAVSLQSGWPTPQADVGWRDRTAGDALIFGVTAPFQVVQDYRIDAGRPLTDIDVVERRSVVVLGGELAETLFESVSPVGQEVRILGERFSVVGVNARKGSVLGQSFDGFVLMPITRFEMLYGRRNTTTVSVKVSTAGEMAPTMARVEEAMRIARRLRPGQDNNFMLET